MKEECGSFMAALSVNVVTVNMLLSVFFLSGVWAACGKSHLFITPKKMEALSGSCLQIPCSFKVGPESKFNFNETIYAMWLKYLDNFGKLPTVIFNSRESVNIYPITIIGNLSQKNCTTLFSNVTTSHSGTYFFRIEQTQDKATAVCDPLQITVKDSPQRPRIEMSGDVKHLKEKESVTITCSAFTPCPHSPPELTWNLQQDSHRQTEKNTDGTFTTKIQQNITLSDTHDGYTITCSATYPVDGGKRVNASETLSVSYAPKDTSASISPSGLVSAGSRVKLSCSSRANPPSSFTWFKISSDGDGNVSEGQVYTFTASDGGSYYCVATNNLGDQKSEILYLYIKGSCDGHSVLKDVILGGIIVILLLVIVVQYWEKTKAATSTEQQNEASQEQEERELHYTEVNVFRNTLDPSSDSVQDRQNLDTANDYVNVSGPPAAVRDTVKDPQCIYAKVKKN